VIVHVHNSFEAESFEAIEPSPVGPVVSVDVGIAVAGGSGIRSTIT